MLGRQTPTIHLNSSKKQKMVMTTSVMLLVIRLSPSICIRGTMEFSPLISIVLTIDSVKAVSIYLKKLKNNILNIEGELSPSVSHISHVIWLCRIHIHRDVRIHRVKLQLSELIAELIKLLSIDIEASVKVCL